MKKGKRLDLHLAESKLSESREKARREIIAGWVKVDGETVRLPSRTVRDGQNVTVERPGGVYVSRGGEKLEHALRCFEIDMNGRVAVDLGASTGGFTHCLLLHGARLVYAVDVGYGQLDFRLRNNPAVRVMERTHVKDLRIDYFDEKADFISADLSFISILKVFGHIRELFLASEGVLLIKPQFEAGPGEQKKGVVRKADSHQAILRRTIPALVAMGMLFRGLCFSPVKGPAGNIEFFVHFNLADPPVEIPDDLEAVISDVVRRAHEALNGDVA